MKRTPHPENASLSRRALLKRTGMLATAGVVLGGGATWVTAQRDEDTDETAARSALIQRYLDGYAGGTIALNEMTGEVREFDLEAKSIHTEIAPGVMVEQWAFTFPGGEPTVPGPEIRVKQGDLVRINFRNTMQMPHTIHLHGITSLAQEMDGVPATSGYILPGGSYTYEFVAAEPGTHGYHCHVQTNLHMDMGMYGALIIEPRGDSAAVWSKEFVLTLDEWDSRQDPNAVKHTSDPNYFLINGKAFPLTEPLEIAEGEIVLMRLINFGFRPHAMHVHGLKFLVIAKDGYDLPHPFDADTLSILPGERYDILIKGRDGTFPFHDHDVPLPRSHRRSRHQRRRLPRRDADADQGRCSASGCRHARFQAHRQPGQCGCHERRFCRFDGKRCGDAGVHSDPAVRVRTQDASGEGGNHRDLDERGFCRAHRDGGYSRE